MGRGASPSGERLMAAAAALAAVLARGQTAEEVSLLVAFFTVLGDDLALLALQAPDSSQSLTPRGPAG